MAYGEWRMAYRVADGHLLSAIRYPLSAIRHRLSAIRHPLLRAQIGHLCPILQDNEFIRSTLNLSDLRITRSACAF